MARIFMKLLFCFIFNLFIFATAIGQQKCGTMDLLNYTHQNDAAKNETLQNLKDFVKKNHQQKVSEGEVYTISCVVHVIWLSQNQNISDKIIHDGIAVLNEDFRKLNNLENVRNEFIDLVADAEIEFCLANVDPEGNPTTGIKQG